MRMSSEQILSAFIPSVKISMYGTLTTFALWVTTNQGLLVFASFVVTTCVSGYSFYITRKKLKMDIKEHEKKMAIYEDEGKYQRLKDESKKLEKENEEIKKDRQENGGC